MTQLVIRLPEEQKQALALEAQRKGETISKVVRRVIARYVEKRNRGNKNELEALIAIAEKGKYLRGPNDLSTNYKKYLYGGK